MLASPAPALSGWGAVALGHHSVTEGRCDVANTWTEYAGKRITMTADQVGVGDGAPEWAKQQWNVTLRCEGRRMSFPYYGGGAAGDPSAEDVVGSVSFDLDTLDRSFEEWCEECGFDVDSRRAERTFRESRRLGRRFVRLIGR